MSASDALLAEARTTTRTVARTFALACRLLPRAVRDDVYRLYLVFRTLDDLVDDGMADAPERLAAVEAWARGGGPSSREARVLADVDRRHVLPRDALLSFCAAMRSDLAQVEIRTEADLDAYCYGVAGTVGVVMTAVLGVRGDVVDARRDAATLGAAMQRTNILRDIDEDRAAGRVYLAADTVARHGGSIAPGAREALLRDQIARADALYDRGLAGVGRLRTGRAAVRAAGVMYREILRQIERDGYGSRAGRATVPRTRKLIVAVRAAA